MIDILIVDDHVVAREGLMAILSRQADFRVVGEAADGRQAVESYDRLGPDIVLMDLRMPGADGFSAIAELATRNPPAKIIVMTTFDGDQFLRRAMQMGAQGYLLKDASRQTLWGAVRQVHAGGSFVDHALMPKIAGAMSGPTLTPRELEVLEQLVHGLSNREIAGALHISEATAKSHVIAILDKLDVSSRTEAAVAATRRGLVGPFE
ncbi:MAG: response regulator transcription factor [Acidobacteriota bacterium]